MRGACGVAGAQYRAVERAVLPRHHHTRHPRELGSVTANLGAKASEGHVVVIIQIDKATGKFSVFEVMHGIMQKVQYRGLESQVTLIAAELKNN